MAFTDICITFAYYWALFLLIFVIYTLLFEETFKKRRYKRPGYSFMVRRLLVLPAVNKLKRRLKKAQLVTSAEIQEKPRSFIDENKTNTQLFVGVDEAGTSLFLKVILHKHRVAEVVLFLNVQGKTYCFPDESRVLWCSTQGRVWQAAGLTITPVEPLNRLRITYNGLLRSASQVQHVKFSLIWNCASAPFYFPQDAHSTLLADALANEPWRNGDWIKLLGDEKGFEQYGVLRGTIQDDTVYLRGFRKKYWGSSEHTTQYRDLLLFAVADDGLAFNVGAKSYRNGCSELKYGSILGADLVQRPMDQHTISLEHVGEHKVPANVVFWAASAKGSRYKCSVTLLVKQGLVAKGTGALNVVPCKLTVNAQNASGFVCFWYQSDGEYWARAQPLLTEPKMKLEQGTYVASLREPASRVEALAGAKSKYLALAATVSANFAVPEGFVVLDNALKPDVARAVAAELTRFDPERKRTWTVRSSGNGCGKPSLRCSQSEVLKVVASMTPPVLVQETVIADRSGVVYTCDPSSGDPSQIVIKLSDGTASVVPRTETGLDVVSAALRLEKAFGFFCKVDWSFSRGALFVIQVEPIDSIYNWTDEELLHEFDTPRMSTKQVPILQSIAEVAQGALTPLAGTIAKDLLTSIYQPLGTNLILHKHQLRLLLTTTPTFQPCNVVKNILARTLRSPNVVSKRPSASGAFQTIQQTLSDLDEVKKRLSLSVRKNLDHFLLLSKFCGSKLSARELLPASSNFEIFHELKGVADAIHQPAEFCKSNGLGWLKAECPEGHRRLRRFLSKYGRRGVRQFDFEGPTWGDSLDLVITELQFQCQPRNSSGEVQKPRRRLLAFLSKMFRESFMERMQFQSAILDGVDNIRALVSDLSKRLTEDGLIPDPGLVHYFSLYELRRLVEDGDKASVPKAERRRQLYPVWNQQHSGNEPEPKGNFFGGNRGKVTGRACVVKDVTELNQLLPGDVLITTSVNINWEKYFLELSGLVTEDSDVRPRGIPCLTGVKGATVTFKTGNIVLLSQHHGTIKLLC